MNILTVASIVSMVFLLLSLFCKSEFTIRDHAYWFAIFILTAGLGIFSLTSNDQCKQKEINSMYLPVMLPTNEMSNNQRMVSL